MSCHYPSCMMGGGNCPYKQQCEADDERRRQQAEEKRRLDLEEQRARIEWMKSETQKNAGEAVKAAITEGETSPEEK